MANRDTDRDEETKETDDNGEEIEYVEEKAEQSPLLRLAEWKFLLTLDDSIVSPSEKLSIETKLNKEIDDYSMSSYYIYLNKLLPQRFPINQDKLLLYETKNKQQLEELNNKIIIAEKNAGDTEIREIMLEKANYYARIGDEDKSIIEYEKTLEKTIGTASKIDVVLSMVRISLAFNNNKNLKKYIEKAKEMVEKGGDWERKNLLLVYEAIYYVIHRNFSAASKLFIDALQTFTCYELFSYNNFILYTIITSMISIDRVTLKEKLLKQPEILSVIDQIPHLRSFLFSLYKCNYSEFFFALTNLYPQLQLDRYYSSHLSYYIREIRIVAYQQFLASYRSVTLSSMATAFGVSKLFLDDELFRFISAGRVNAKIDRVSGTVEAIRKDLKNSHYQQVLKSGDQLLHRIQKLTKVISY